MKNKLRKNFSKIIFVILFVTVFLSIGQLANGKVPSIFGYRIFRVVSQSMVPTIPDDTCIIIKSVNQNDLKEGDIITFLSQDPQIYGHYNTHRIHKIEETEDGTKLYVTKGDANAVADQYKVSYSQITGRYVKELPFGVWIAKGLKALMNRNVYFIAIILPIVICIISYVWQLIGIITGRDDKDEDDNETENDEENEGDDHQRKMEKADQKNKISSK